jgi:hypothetical protein
LGVPWVSKQTQIKSYGVRLSMFADSIPAIVIILKEFDHKSPPEWPAGFNLNGLLALLSSVAKIAFVVPVIEGLGQLRWLWFSRSPRPLSDFDVIDNAARVSYASFKLLFAYRGGSVTNSNLELCKSRG